VGARIFILPALAAAMAINELRNKLSDPGAVPGASTRGRASLRTTRGLGRGRNRIDEGVKEDFSLGMIPPLSGQTL